MHLDGASHERLDEQRRRRDVVLRGGDDVRHRRLTRPLLDLARANLVDAEQELLDAKVNLVRAQRDEIVSSYQLAAAVGRLTAQSLRLPVEVYDPTVNCGQTRDRWMGTSVNEDEAAKTR